MVCATHDEIDRVTEAIRLSRKHHGKLGEGVQIGKDVSLNWTTAQKCDMRNYRPGHSWSFIVPSKESRRTKPLRLHG